MARGSRFELTFTRPPKTTTSDARGFAPAGEPATTRMRGSVDLLSAREVQRAAAMGIRATAAARVSLRSDVGAADEVEVGGTLPEPDAQIAGGWLVSAVQHTRTHLRVLMRRAE